MSEDIEENSLIENATDMLSDTLTGIPAPVKKNAFKAFAQLCTAVVDIPVAHLEGIASEKRAETQARINIINTGAKQISEQMNIDPEYAKIAVKKYGNRIIRERVNLDMISEKAALELKKDSSSNIENNEETTLEKDISEDWLNSFEKEASEKSSEEMQDLFSKILAGEIKKPSTFSIKSVKTLSQLDNEVARLFQTICSLCISLKYDGDIIDARVVSLSGTAASNSLQQYGLNFSNLNILEEYGLIISDYNSYMDYASSVINLEESTCLPFEYNSNSFVLINDNLENTTKELKLSGIGLTKTGKELFSIIDSLENQRYTKDFFEFFKRQKLTMKKID